MSHTRRRFLELCATLAAVTPAMSASRVFGADLPLIRMIGAAPVIRPDLAYQFLGIPMGYYEKLGFRGEFMTIAGSASAVQLLLSGEGEIASVGFLELAEAKKTQPDLPVTCIYIHEVVSGYQIVVPPESAIQDLKDFAGRKVGVSNLASGAVPVFKGMMKRVGVDPDSVTLLPVGTGAQALAALKGGQVDGLTAFIGQISAIENLGQELRYFVPPLPAGGFVVADEMIEKKPELVTKVLQGIVLNQIAMQKYPEIVVKAFWKMNGKPAGDLATALKQGVHYVENTAKTFKPVSDPALFGSFTEADWVNLKEFTGGTGVLSPDAKLSDYYTDRFLADANKVDLALLEDAVKSFEE